MITPHIFHKRVHALIVVAVVVLMIFGLRLVDVQAVQADGYTKRANNEMVTSSVMLAPRGTITDVNGVVLARSDNASRIVVDQTMITDPAKTAHLLASVLSMPEAQLTTLLTGVRRYQIILPAAPPAVWDNLQNSLSQYNSAVLKTVGGLSKRIVGFFREYTFTREYPTGSLAASLIGFTNASGIGAAGLETSLQSELAGKNGSYKYVNGDGAIIPGSQQFITQAKAGSDIRLTIDRDVQWVAQNAITEAVKSSGAASGTVIVMDPKSGAVLAQASAPSFDPSQPKTETPNNIRNPAIQDVYEPGSTGKIITVAAALEEKKTTPETVYTIPNVYKVAGRQFKDDVNHVTEHLTTAGILAISSNIGAIQIGQSISHQTFYDYLRKFGIGQSTGSNLPGESMGILHPVSAWSDSSAPTMSFGQGYSVTAMQATDVFSAIANDGVRVTPNVVAGIIDSTGHYTPSDPSQIVQVVSVDTARKIRTMLEGVVSEAGTAPAAQIPGYKVAGKTGTAMRSDPTCGCYRGYTASFIGMAPADAPRYVVSVVVQNPTKQHFGGVVAAPVFKKVMSFVLQAKQIPPVVTSNTVYPLTEQALLSARKPRAVVKPGTKA
jgi:cell division protein FtsI (penicillin-binding protein 3)